MNLFKAFDAVWQDSMPVRLFIKKPTEHWHAHTSLLEDIQLEVKFGGQYRSPFTIKQGVGQGKILSTKTTKTLSTLPKVLLSQQSRM